MKNRDYSIEYLWVVTEENNNESFICKESYKGLIEIFSGCILDIEKNKYLLKPLSQYYEPIIRMFYKYKNLDNLLDKLNEINYLNFYNNYNNEIFLKDLEFINKPIKWYKNDVLKSYNLNQLYIAKNMLEDMEYLFMCKFNSKTNSYIDIFTRRQIISDNIILLTDFLQEKYIICDYNKLNIYSLLRLYLQINRINNYQYKYFNELEDINIYQKTKKII